MTEAFAAAGAPTRRGPYFGWRVVAALFLCVFALLGVAIYAFIMFAKPLSQQFGWSAAQTGSLVSAMWVVGPLALVAAPIITRFGAWRLIMVGMLVQVLVLAAMVGATAFWHVYLLRMTMGVGKILVMTSVPVIVARWFERRFATAMAIAWSGGAAGGIVLSPLTEHLVSAMGWRSAALVLSVGLLAVTLVAGLWARGAASPKDLALRPDGDPLDSEHPLSTAHETERAAERSPGGRQVLGAINKLTLAVMAISVIGAGMASIALQSQEPALFEAAGMSPSTAAALLGLTAAAALVGSVAVGWLLDRFHVLVICFAVAATMFGGLAAFTALIHSPNVLVGGLAAASAGFALGAGEVVWITLFKRQFGVAAFAITYGIFYFCLQVGFATGGLAGGWALEHLSLAGFLGVVALMYLPPAIFSAWRPGGKNGSPTD